MFFVVLPFTAVREVSFFSIGKASELGLFFVAGMAFTKLGKAYSSADNQYAVIAGFSLLVMWILSFIYLEGTSYFVICRMLGVGMIISFAIVLSARNHSILDLLVESCYLIFLLSLYFNIASQQVLSHIIHYPWYVYSILSIITGIVIPVCAYKYLKKHRESRWCKITAILLGQHFR